MHLSWLGWCKRWMLTHGGPIWHPHFCRSSHAPPKFGLCRVVGRWERQVEWSKETMEGGLGWWEKQPGNGGEARIQQLGQIVTSFPGCPDSSLATSKLTVQIQVALLGPVICSLGEGAWIPISLGCATACSSPTMDMVEANLPAYSSMG